jgi:hypothetical protein
MTVKIAAALPPTLSANGLAKIEEQLISDPTELHVVIAVIRTKTITTTPSEDGDEVIPTAKIVHIEPITGHGSASTARELLAEAHNVRTGQHTLPFDDANG